MKVSIAGPLERSL